MKKRLLGIKVFGVLFALLGATGLAQVVLRLTQPNLINAHVPINSVVLVSTLFCVIGFGLLMLWNGIRWLIVIGASTVLIFVVVSFAMDAVALGRKADWMGLVVNVAFFGFIIWYFLRPGVKAQFVKTTNR